MFLCLPPLGRRLRALMLIGATLGSGCTAGVVSLRPDGSPGPEPCPAKALETMRILRLRPGEDVGTVEIDANQSWTSPISVNDGPIESVLRDGLGYLDGGTRLYGKVWTSGPMVVIRYYEARPPDGDTIHFCAVARLSKGQMRKLPGSRPGNALLEFSSAALHIVDSFR